MPITFIGFSLLLCYHMHHHHRCNITFCGSTVVLICRSATLEQWNVSITVRWFALKPRSGVSRRFDWMIPLTFLLMHREVNICGFGSKVTTTIGLTAMMSAHRKLWCVYSEATALYSFLSACSTIFLGLILSLMTTIQVQFEQRGLDQFRNSSEVSYKIWFGESVTTVPGLRGLDHYGSKLFWLPERWRFKYLND